MGKFNVSSAVVAPIETITTPQGTFIYYSFSRTMVNEVAGTMVVSIRFSEEVQLDSVVVLGASDTTGLTYTINVLDDAAASTTVASSVAQTVETRPRSTSNQFFKFTEIAAREVVVSIAGASEDMVVAAIIPCINAYTPLDLNQYSFGSDFQLAPQKNRVQGLKFGRSFIDDYSRQYSLSSEHLSSEERDKLVYAAYQVGHNPCLIELDDEDSSAERWMVADLQLTSINNPRFEQNTTTLNFQEIHAWQ